MPTINCSHSACKCVSRLYSFDLWPLLQQTTATPIRYKAAKVMDGTIRIFLLEIQWCVRIQTQMLFTSFYQDNPTSKCFKEKFSSSLFAFTLSKEISKGQGLCANTLAVVLVWPLVLLPSNSSPRMSDLRLVIWSWQKSAFETTLSLWQTLNDMKVPHDRAAKKPKTYLSTQNELQWKL